MVGAQAPFLISHFGPKLTIVLKHDQMLERELFCANVEDGVLGSFDPFASHMKNKVLKRAHLGMFQNYCQLWAKMGNQKRNLCPHRMGLFYRSLKMVMLGL